MQVLSNTIGDFARGQRHDDAVLTLHPTGQATR